MRPCIDKRREELLGKEFETNSCGKCFVIEYKGANDVKVMFYDPPFIATCQLGQLRDGRVKNPYVPSLYGKGYIGEGVTSVTDRKTFQTWCGVLERAYNSKYVKKNPTYVGVEVCEDWLCFQNFAKWCYSQKGFKVRDNLGNYFQLDKDILVKGNKVYSPETCCFVPQEINKLVLKSAKTRGKLPIGVSAKRWSEGFVASINKGAKKLTVGNFKTVEEAFSAYSGAKESYIKEIAGKWKEQIDSRVYESLMSYKVDIDD